MHAKEFLHKTLSSVIHKKRLSVLADLVQGLLINKKLSVTELGRGISTQATEHSAIRRSDRLIGNKHIHAELFSIYATQIALIIGSKQRPEIIVDWTHIPNTKFYALRAALACKGRALTLYEEVHTEKKLGNRKIERNFLKQLKKLIPNHCIPIIVTDAGFHNEWFKTVLMLEWDYVGRVRGLKVYHDGKNWIPCKSLMSKATKTEKYLGEFMLCKSTNKITTNFFLIKEKKKIRKQYGIHKSRRGGRDRKNHRLSAKEPWLLVSSLKGKNYQAAKRVVKTYKKRMQIEEAFRDLKSPRFGFGFRHAYSRSLKRIVILLLVAMLASFVAWLTGYVIEQKKQHFQFQVNSVKSKRVLSLFFLGCRAINRQIEVKISELFGALQAMREDEKETGCV